MMGKYINIGNTDFASVRRDEYVDKSQLIAYVNHVLGTQRKFLCVTRARQRHECVIVKVSGDVAINVATKRKSGDKSNSIGDKNKKLILEYLAAHSEVKSHEIAEVLDLGISRTKVYLSELADVGFIIRVGANKDRTYKLKQN